MQQIKIYLHTTSAEANSLDSLFSFFAEESGYPIGVSEINEKKDIFEFFIYLPEEQEAEVIAYFAENAPSYMDKVKIEKLDDINWVAHSLAGLKPIEAGCFFIYGSHDKERVPEDKIAIQIEANQAFGTGHHETTHCCLEYISQYTTETIPNKVLDLGTGSGILAIALAKLGCKNVYATDIDAVALKIAQENFVINSVANQIQSTVADGFTHEFLETNAPYDLIVSNILAGPLVELAPQMISKLAPNGRIILSGILASQKDWVLDTYVKSGLCYKSTKFLGDWVALDFSLK